MNTKVTAIVNAVIPPVDIPSCLCIERASFEEVYEAAQEGVPHYIRHSGTAILLNRNPQAGFYAPKVGDVYYVLRLKSGIAPRGTEVEARPEDLDILKVKVTECA